MKQILPFVLLAWLLTLPLTSCDKMDCNGRLDGNWQLTRWEDRSSGEVRADKHTGIYYCVKLDLIQLKRLKEGRPTFLTRFVHRDDSLFIGEVHMSPFDEIVSRDKLVDYGVEPDGKFRVEVLNRDRMVLSNPHSILTFRKY